MMSSPTAATTSSSSIPIHVSERRRLPSDGLNPRRIQTGLPGIRRTVYDGALRVNSDAQDVLCATLRDVAASIETNPNHNNNSSNNNGNDNNLVTKLSLAAKPELRKYFPLNALPRPSMDDTPHDDEFHIPITNKKRRTTIHITELTNHIVTTQQSRIVNPTTGERALCAVESVETVAKNKLVEILDSGLIESDDDEEPPEQVENENRHANGQDGGGVVVGAAEDAEAVVVIPIRGGGDGNADADDEDVIMEGEGGEQTNNNDQDVDMAEEVAATTGVGGGFNDASTAADVSSAVASSTTATATNSAVREGGSVAVIAKVAAPDTEATTTVEAVVPAVAAPAAVQGEVKDATTQEQPPPTATVVATATDDDKSQEVSSTNVVFVGQQGVADDVPSSSSTQVAAATSIATAAVAATSSSSGVTTNVTTSSTTNPPQANTVKSAEIHPLPPNHPPLSTSIPITTAIIISAPENAPSWYNPSTISTTEKTSLPEWFNSSAPHRTPTTYLSTRNQILQIYQTQVSSSSHGGGGGATNTNTTTTTTGGGGGQQQQYYLTSTAIRRVVPGDVGSLLRLHSFLCDWGLINGKDVGENAPSDLALRGGSNNSAAVSGIGSGGDTEKRKFEEVKRSTFWSKERLEQLDSVVVKHVKSNVVVVAQTVSGVEGMPQQQQLQQPSVDWDSVAKDIGEGVTASDCQRAFLDPPTMTDEVSVKIAKTSSSSSSGFDLSTLLDGVHPDVLNATITASLKATNDITEARKASIAGLLASTASTKAHSEEEEIARTLMDILDQRMQRLENRVAILDDVEALLEAERVALELERRDMYTTRCRHWFGDGSS